MKMKNLHVLQLVALSAAATMLPSCGGLNTMLKQAPQVTYKCTPNPLEMHGDSVQVTITGQYPAKFFNKKAVMEVVPVLRYEGGEQAFKSQSLQGEAVEANATIISFEQGGSFNYTAKVPYKNEMAKSQLFIKAKASIKDKAIDLPEYKIADGVIATPRLAHTEAKPIQAIDQYRRRTPNEQELAALFFQVNKANVDAKALKKPEFKTLQEFLKGIDTAKQTELTQIGIDAYASPDGPEALNGDLATKRGAAADKFLKEKVAKKLVNANKEGIVAVQDTAEDWGGFKKLMEASSVQDKELILRVLQMNSDPAVREKEIKNIAKAYKQISKDILPKLRRSKFVVKYDKVGRSDSALIADAQDAAKVLNIEEYLRAATLTAEAAKQEAILANATKNNAQEWRAFNNLACAQIAQNKLDEAKANLQKADELSQGATMVKNNLGVVAFLKGNESEAVKYYEMAAGAGKEVNYNQAVIKIKQGKYQQAVEMFGSSTSFNSALAKLLNGDNDGALKTISEAENQNDPLGYYLKAIIGARSQNTDLLFTNLRTAVGKDASLAAKAKTDMEFNKYFEDATFKSIVQ